MSGRRTVATPAALQAAQQLRATVLRLKPQAQQIIAQGQVLTQPNVWDGGSAGRFRDHAWPQARQSLNQTMQTLEQIDSHAQRVIQDIMKAGAGSLVPPPPKPKPKPASGGGGWQHWGGWGWVHAALTVASFIPVVGSAAALVNAGIYAAQGDYLMAGLSALGAIPLVGDAADAISAGRLAVEGVEAASDVAQVVRVGEEGAQAVRATEEGAQLVEQGGAQALERGVASDARSAVSNEVTPAQQSELTQHFQDIGGDSTRLRFNQGSRTGYVDDGLGTGHINVRGDVYPNPDGVTANATMSPRAALAHELGHAHFDEVSPPGSPDYLPPGNLDDETRVSMWAAENTPNLSDAERYSLIQDAMQRGGVIPSSYQSFIDQVTRSMWGF